MRRLAFAAIPLAALMLTACSDPDTEPEAAPDTSTAPVNPLESPVLEEENEEGARNAVDAYIEAVRTGDGQVGCFTLSEEARQSLGEDNEGVDCAEAFTKTLTAPDTTAKTGDVELAEDGASAIVHLEYSDPAQEQTPSVVVLWTDGVWLLESAHAL